MDEFVIWQEFLYIAYGPLIMSVVAGIVASGLLASLVVNVIDHAQG